MSFRQNSQVLKTSFSFLVLPCGSSTAHLLCYFSIFDKRIRIIICVHLIAVCCRPQIWDWCYCCCSSSLLFAAAAKKSLVKQFGAKLFSECRKLSKCQIAGKLKISNWVIENELGSLWKASHSDLEQEQADVKWPNHLNPGCTHLQTVQNSKLFTVHRHINIYSWCKNQTLVEMVEPQHVQHLKNFNFSSVDTSH